MLVALVLCAACTAAVADPAATAAARSAAPQLFSEPSDIVPASQVIINNHPINGAIATMTVPGVGEFCKT